MWSSEGILNNMVRDIIAVTGLVLTMIQVIALFFPLRRQLLTRTSETGPTTYSALAVAFHDFRNSLSLVQKKYIGRACIVIFGGVLFSTVYNFLFLATQGWVNSIVGFVGAIGLLIQIGWLSFLGARIYQIPADAFMLLGNRRMWRLSWAICLLGIFLTTYYEIHNKDLIGNHDAMVKMFLEGVAYQIYVFYMVSFCLMLFVTFRVYQSMFRDFSKQVFGE